MLRPQIHPGLRRLWRDATTIQLGALPDHGSVVSGLRAGDDSLLAAMDGAHDIAALQTLGRRLGAPDGRVGELVDLLLHAGALVTRPGGRQHHARLAEQPPARRARLLADGRTWSLAYQDGGDGFALAADRSRRSVRIDGGSTIADELLRVLAAVGVRTDDPPEAAADLVVLVRDDALDPRVGDTLVRQDVAHLAVLRAADRVVVGPLVLPGRSPCLRCLDLRRRDRDPAWPALAAQLLTRSPGTTEPGEPASAVLAAGLAAVQVLTYLDARAEPDTVGRTVDVLLPQGRLERRRWTAHPACGCLRLPVDESADDADDPCVAQLATPSDRPAGERPPDRPHRPRLQPGSS